MLIIYIIFCKQLELHFSENMESCIYVMPYRVGECGAFLYLLPHICLFIQHDTCKFLTSVR